MIKVKEELFLAEMGIHPQTIIEGDYSAKYKLKDLLKKYAEQYNIADVRLSLPTDEEIKQKSFDFSYVFRDDEDCKRSDAVETYCEEMGHWIKNKIQGNEA